MTYFANVHPPHWALRRVAYLATLASTLYCPEAAAQEAGSAGGGLFFGVSLGDRGPRFEMGGEAFGMYRIIGAELDRGPCDTGPRAGVGPLLQLSWVHDRGLKYTLAVHGGAEVSTLALAGTVELGLTHRPKTEALAFRIGALVQPIWMLNMAVRSDIGLGETFLGSGFRYYPTFGSIGCGGWGQVSDGRPLRIDGQSGESRTATSGHLGERWARQAQEECEAIGAFLNLAQDLVAVGAPDALIQRALSAAEDEMRHTEKCAALAREHGASTSPTFPQEFSRRVLTGAPGLARLAVEGLLDGYQNEGISADSAQVAARETRDVPLQGILAMISREESSHATLGLDVARWALDEDKTDQVRDAVATLRHEDRTFLPRAGDEAFQGNGFLAEVSMTSLIEENDIKLKHVAIDLVG